MKEEKDEKKGLSASQKKLPPALQAAIMKNKGKKHMDADDVEARDIDKNGKIDGWEVGKANAMKKSMKGKDFDDESESEDKDESFFSRIPTFTEWVRRKEAQ
jgi:hypothetical protein